MKVTTETLTDYLNNKCDETTKIEIDLWLGEDSSNKNYLDELRLYWNSGSKQDLSFDAERGFESLSSKIKERKQVKKSLFRKQLLRYAAAAVLLISLGLTGWVYNWQGDPEHIVVANNEPIDKIIVLPDGSQVKLAQGSSFEYPSEFSEKRRLVKLNGEAFFDITPNKNKAFVIETECTKTKVLGTSFRITEVPNQTKIEVSTGIVEFMDLSDPSNKVHLLRGDIAQFNRRQSAMLVKNNKKTENDYNVKRLRYSNKKLGEICGDLQEIFDCRIEYASNDIPDLKLTAIFEDQNLESIIESICFSLHLEKEGNNKFILLTKME